MLIIWKGWGLGIALLAVPISLWCASVFTGLFAGSPLAMRFGILYAGIMSASLVWMLGYRLNNPKDRVSTGTFSNAQSLPRNQHTLFFIPIQFWAVLFLFYGLLGLVTGFK